MRPSTDRASSHTSRGRGVTVRANSSRRPAWLVGGQALVVLTMLLLPWLGTAAQAQGAVRSTHGDWQIRCDTPPGAQGEQCALIQSVVAEDRSNAGLTVIVLKTADQKSQIGRASCRERV